MKHNNDANPERFAQLLEKIRYKLRSWLVIGVAGFIGSNLLELLLQNVQKLHRQRFANESTGCFAPKKAKNQVYNVALGDRTSLLEVFTLISEQLKANNIEHPTQPEFTPFRPLNGLCNKR